MEYGATLVSIETPGNSATAQMRFERYEPRGTISVADRPPMSWQYAPYNGENSYENDCKKI